MPQAQRPTAIDARLVNPIVNATIEVLHTMANTTVKLKEVTAKLDHQPNGDISAVITIIGEDGEGMVSISFTEALARMFVSRFLGMGPEELSMEECTDGIGEIVNIISGNSKTVLSQDCAEPYKLSLPTIILGSKHQVCTRWNTPALVIIFETEGSEFNLQVSFKPKDN